MTRNTRLISGTFRLRRALVLVLVAAAAAFPAGSASAGTPPSGATAECRDGTYSFSQHHSGACSSHGGVELWLDGSSAAGSSSGASYGETSGAACGVERWSVKTLQDRPRLLPARTTTIHFLVTRPAPEPLPTTRLPFERHVYTVIAAVTLVRQEADSDLHLVLQAADGEHMIAEAPAPTCDSKATPQRRQQMLLARSRVRLCANARVTGVTFFDSDHGQTGVAPNAIELHPVLGFTCLSG